MAYFVDDIDCAIVNLLQEDGRMPCAEIARRIGFVTERVVRLRIKHLTERGIIKVSAFVQPDLVGYPVTADVWVEVENGQVRSVSERLMKFEEVSYLACSTGDRDISMQVFAPTIDHLYEFVTQTVASVPGVKRASMVVVPKILKDIQGWMIPSAVILPNRTTPTALGIDKTADEDL